MNDTFWVGVYPGLENQHLDYIYETINDFIRKVDYIQIYCVLI